MLTSVSRALFKALKYEVFLKTCAFNVLKIKIDHFSIKYFMYLEFLKMVLLIIGNLENDNLTIFF